MLNHAQILGVKDISSSLILKNRHIFTRTLLLDDGILPAARMCTGSLVCISSYQIIAEQAAAGIGNTHRTMYKCFNLHIIRNICTDLLDFLKRKLTCSYDALRSQPIPEFIGFIVCIICLCTDMTLNLRTDFLCIGKNSRICDDQCIRL